MLKRITTHDVEPADLDVTLAPRLDLLAGDNGLGKTFLLDLAWWALTGTWAQHPVIPRRGDGSRPRIQWALRTAVGDPSSSFDFRAQTWDHGHALEAGLVIYARPDGGFDIVDPARVTGVPLGIGNLASHRFSMTVREVWEGLSADGTTLCNGLIRDWLTWQFQKPAVFDLFTRVLARLSPHAGEVIAPGPPRRVSIEDARDIPTIVLPYGNVPVTHASAGMRRVLALAYVLVWTWLVSEAIGLHQGRSLSAERAIEAAEAFARGGSDAARARHARRDPRRAVARAAGARRLLAALAGRHGDHAPLIAAAEEKRLAAAGQGVETTLALPLPGEWENGEG